MNVYVVTYYDREDSSGDGPVAAFATQELAEAGCQKFLREEAEEWVKDEQHSELTIAEAEAKLLEVRFWSVDEVQFTG